MAVGDQEAKEETPGFTVYVNRRPTSMTEVVKDLETQFRIVCNSANEVSALLEASRAQYASTTNELTATKMLNPVALFRSASSRSSSSRFFVNSSSSKDEGYESSSDFSEEPCMYSGSHQSTLDRLYAWEKKLYEEVRVILPHFHPPTFQSLNFFSEMISFEEKHMLNKASFQCRKLQCIQSGERVRIAYEKKCTHLRNQDVKGEDPNSVDKTRVSIRDLHTQIKISIHSVEAVSKRIETLRDVELQPQLFELVQGGTVWHLWRLHSWLLAAVSLFCLGLKAGKDVESNGRVSSVKKRTWMEPSFPSRFKTRSKKEFIHVNNRSSQTSPFSCILRQNSGLASLFRLMESLLTILCASTNWLATPVCPVGSCPQELLSLSAVQWNPSDIWALHPMVNEFLDSIRETAVLDDLDFFANGMGCSMLNS
ncbi:hypothetical protein CJ030_MR8G009064 [Morella rubra]|uniref:DUF632 domain-containing protein n=1 Tax=Morella rubra TaxID=262757 RepID=A0A6A1UW25_9ROSI|nr:hypothetical protein CJ030_MR8G009064 [Morella rubra]